MFNKATLAAWFLGGSLVAASPFAVAIVAPSTDSGLFSGAIADAGNPELEIDFRLDNTLAAVGSLGEVGYGATARTDFGVNRAFAQVVGGDPFEGPFVGAVSVWADKFTVTDPGGASGAFSAQVSVTVSGTLSGADYAEGGYALFALTQQQAQDILNGGGEFLYDQFIFGLPNDPAYGSPIIIEERFSDESPVSGTFVLTGTVHGTYGEAFYLVSVLNVYAEEDGLIDASNSAVFGISVPTGTSLATDSTTVYAQAVPEPETTALLLAGLAFVAVIASRQRQRSA